MTELEAREWIRSTFDLDHARMARLDRFVDRLRATTHNLVARSTFETIWSRHIADSAQLLLHAPPEPRRWLDIGTGGGFPGLICAAISQNQFDLVEPRGLRARFLQEASEDLGCGSRVHVHSCKLEQLSAFSADIISARAVTALATLLRLAHRFSSSSSIWLLPRGESASSDLAVAKKSFKGVFHVKRSVVDDAPSIVVGHSVMPR